MTKENKFTNINTYLIIALVIVVGVGLYFTLSVPTVTKEAPKVIPPKEVVVTILGGCDECFNISVATDFLKQQKNLNITSVKELSLEESKAKAGEYNISKLPAVVVTGDTANLTIQNFNRNGDALVFSQTPPPYYDIKSGAVKGKVTVTVLEDKSCTNCFDMNQVIEQLKQAGIKLSSETKVDSKSTEGKQLISQYKIEKLPTIIFNKDALEYDVVKQVWSQVGSEESDGKLVLRFVSPPYVNVSTGKTDGLVDLTILTDSSCKECFNASVLSDLFKQSFNMVFKKTQIVDVSSTQGKTLAKKYSIELVPTVVLSKDATAYPNIGQAWGQVGTQEKDGSFVFRNVPLLKDYFDQAGQSFAYKNTTSGEILPKAGQKEEADITAPAEEK
jgi:thiol-disulfide isomerase/thioredoxin